MPIFREARVKGAGEAIRSFVHRACSAGTPFETLFSGFDVDGDGVLSLADLDLVLPEFALELTAQEKAMLLQSFTFHGSLTQCTFEEFRRFIGPIAGTSARRHHAAHDSQSPSSPGMSRSATFEGGSSSAFAQPHVAAGAGAPLGSLSGIASTMGHTTTTTTLPPISSASHAPPVVPALALGALETSSPLLDSARDLEPGSSSKGNASPNPMESRVSSILSAAAVTADAARPTLQRGGTFHVSSPREGRRGRSTSPRSTSPRFVALQNEMSDVKAMLQTLINSSNRMGGGAGEEDKGHSPAEPQRARKRSSQGSVPGRLPKISHDAATKGEVTSLNHSILRDEPLALHSAASFKKHHDGLWDPLSPEQPGRVPSPALSQETKKSKKKKGKSKSKTKRHHDDGEGRGSPTL